jgi:PAS domain S-box-containing protein
MGTTEITLDITDRKRAEERLSKAKDELELRVEQRTAELVEVNEKLRQELEERKRVEKDLHETKNLLSNTFNALQDSVVVIDKDLRVRLSNWKGHDYISQKDRQGYPYCYEVFMNRKKPCSPCHAMEVFATGEIKQLEDTNPIDGKIRDIRALPMFDDKGKVVAVIEHLRDISELKQAESALRESEEKYRELFENESDAVMIFDAETLRFEDANRATLDLYGYAKEEFLTLAVADVSAEKEKTRVAVKKLKSGELGGEFVPLRYFKRKDGSVFPGEINAGDFISKGRKKIIGAVRDITERMNAQEDLRKSEKRYRDLFNSIPIGLYQTTPEGSILDVNPAMLEILGFPDRNTLLQTKSPETYIDPEDRKQFQRLMVEKGFVHNFMVQLHRHDGRRIWVTIDATFVHDTDSQMTYYEGAMADITDRKASEERIHKLSQQLIQAQEDERQMISRELHDTVAQDLSSLKIASETLFDNQPAASSEIRQKVSEFSRILERTILTVRDLTYDLRPPGLDDMGLVAALSMYCEEFTEKSRIMVDFQACGLDVLTLDFDSEINLYRLVQEGLNNIRKHADANRAIVRLVVSFPNLVLQIEDDGKGFDVEERTRAADSGKRIGLRSMVERVNLLGGQMKIRSRPKKGTRIEIKLPYQENKDDSKNDHLNRR